MHAGLWNTGTVNKAPRGWEGGRCGRLDMAGGRVAGPDRWPTRATARRPRLVPVPYRACTKD